MDVKVKVKVKLKVNGLLWAWERTRGGRLCGGGLTAKGEFEGRKNGGMSGGKAAEIQPKWAIGSGG